MRLAVETDQVELDGVARAGAELAGEECDEDAVELVWLPSILTEELGGPVLRRGSGAGASLVRPTSARSCRHQNGDGSSEKAAVSHAKLLVPIPLKDVFREMHSIQGGSLLLHFRSRLSVKASKPVRRDDSSPRNSRGAISLSALPSTAGMRTPGQRFGGKVPRACSGSSPHAAASAAAAPGEGGMAGVVIVIASC